MAGLGSGNYRFSNSVDNNKTYIYVKLTESAQKALDEFIKNKNSSKSQPSQPSITFNGNEGEISFPSQNHGRSSFKYNMQKVQDNDGPQGSFESIRQDSYNLDSLGPMLHVMRIQAKDDSYEKTRQSMANAMAQNGKTCVKELKQNNLMSRHRPTRPSSMVVPPHKKEPSNFSSIPYSSHNGNTTNTTTTTITSSSPHRSSSSGKPSWNASQKPLPISKKINEALKKRPLRERIIQLLAIKPLNKLQILQRIRADGVKECDNRHISSVLQSITPVKNNAYHLPAHLWVEVNEDWSFYTEEEKAAVQRNKPSNLSPKDSHQPASLSPPPAPSVGGASDTLKRVRETSAYDPCVKKSRTNNNSRIQDRIPDYDVTTTTTSGISFGDESPKGDSRLRDSRRPQWQAKRDDQRRLDPLSNDAGPINGHSPSATSVSPLSQNNSPKNPPNPVNKPPDTSAILSNGYRNAFNNNNSNNNNNHSRSDKINYTNNHYNNNNNSTDLIHQSSSPASSPDSQQENKDVPFDFREQYSKIENSEQRRQYKTEFNNIYDEYQILHSDLEKTKLYFKELETSLNEQIFGSPEYHRIKQKMCDEYETRQVSFQEKKHRYHHLDEVLKHIKQHVNDFDALQQRKRQQQQQHLQ